MTLTELKLRRSIGPVSRCSRCTKQLPVSAFLPDPHHGSGWSRYCRPCKQTYTADYQRSPKGRKRHNRAAREYERRERKESKVP